MSMENFKTIVLINLVVISLFLTFNLWTYVPDSTSMQNAKFVQGNEGMNQTKISDVVRPTSIIVHKDKNHYGSRREADIESIYKPLEVGNYMILKRYQSLRVISFHMCMVKGKLNLFSLPISHLMQ